MCVRVHVCVHVCIIILCTLLHATAPCAVPHIIMLPTRYPQLIEAWLRSSGLQHSVQVGGGGGFDFDVVCLESLMP